MKLELSVSSPVATSLEVSMAHQPATFSFPKRKFSKSKLVMHSFQAGWLVSFHMELHHYIIMRLQIVIELLLCKYVCAMDKKPSGNTDTALSAIVITIIISYMACIFKVLCSGVTMYKRVM